MKPISIQLLRFSFLFITSLQEYRNKDTSAYYINTSITTGKQERSDFDDDNKFLATCYIHRASTKKYYNFYYGIGAG